MEQKHVVGGALTVTRYRERDAFIFTTGGDELCRLTPSQNGTQEERDAAVAKLLQAIDTHPHLANTLVRMTEKVERALVIRSSGGKVVAEDWDELHVLADEAREMLRTATSQSVGRFKLTLRYKNGETDPLYFELLNGQDIRSVTQRLAESNDATVVSVDELPLQIL